MFCESLFFFSFIFKVLVVKMACFWMLKKLYVKNGNLSDQFTMLQDGSLYKSMLINLIWITQLLDVSQRRRIKTLNVYTQMHWKILLVDKVLLHLLYNHFIVLIESLI